MVGTMVAMVNSETVMRNERGTRGTLTREEAAYIVKFVTQMSEETNQMETANKLNISQSSISNIIKGVPVGVEVARQVAKYLNVTISDLITVYPKWFHELRAKHPEKKWGKEAINSVIRDLRNVEHRNMKQVVEILDKRTAGYKIVDEMSLIEP